MTPNTHMVTSEIQRSQLTLMTNEQEGQFQRPTTPMQKIRIRSPHFLYWRLSTSFYCQLTNIMALSLILNKAIEKTCSELVIKDFTATLLNDLKHHFSDHKHGSNK